MNKVRNKLYAMKKVKKKKSMQQQFRSKDFKFDQYWNVHFTEKYKDGSEKDFKTVVKSRSALLAKEILTKKSKEDDNSVKIKSISCFMFHRNGEVNSVSLNIQDWSLIRKCSFPNEVNILFKHHKPRPEGYSNRFNALTGTKKTYFSKKFHEVRKSLNEEKYTKEEKSKMVYKGRWIAWPESEREALKERIILLLRANNNNRNVVSTKLGYANSRSLRKLMTEQFIEVDWDKDFPINKECGWFHADPLTVQKRLKGLKESANLRHIELCKNLLPEVKKLFESGMPRYKIAEKLGRAKNTINKVLKYANIKQ